jgi:hypothetical protein
VELVVDANDTMSFERWPAGSATNTVDTDVMLKAILRRGSLQDASGLSVATGLGPLLPTLGGEHRFGAEAHLIVSQRWTALTLHFDNGAALTRSGTYGAVTGVIIEGPHTMRVRPVAELLASRDGRASAESALLGTIWQASSSVTFDIATVGALEEGLVICEVRTGLTWAVPMWNAAQVPKPGPTEPMGAIAIGSEDARKRAP